MFWKCDSLIVDEYKADSVDMMRRPRCTTHAPTVLKHGARIVARSRYPPTKVVTMNGGHADSSCAQPLGGKQQTTLRFEFVRTESMSPSPIWGCPREHYHCRQHGTSFCVDVAARDSRQKVKPTSQRRLARDSLGALRCVVPFFTTPATMQGTPGVSGASTSAFTSTAETPGAPPIAGRDNVWSAQRANIACLHRYMGDITGCLQCSHR